MIFHDALRQSYAVLFCTIITLHMYNGVMVQNYNGIMAFSISLGFSLLNNEKGRSNQAPALFIYAVTSCASTMIPLLLRMNS